MSHHKCILLSPLQICYILFCKPSPVRKQFSHSSQTVFFSSMSGNAMVCAGTTTGSTKSSQGLETLSDAFVAVTTEAVMGRRSQQHIDEHALLLPSKIALIALVYSSFKLIQAPAIIIILFWPLLGCCNRLFETKDYQSMLNQHFVITTRIASRNYFVHKSALYQHSISILEASDFNHSIFPQVLPISLRWKQLSLRIKASQDWSLELLWQSVAFKLSYSKVLGAIAAPSFVGLFLHTINWNS